jgi:hypothetical protein
MNSPYGARAAYSAPAHGGYPSDHLSPMDWLLPAPAVPLMILLLIVLPLGLLSAQSLLLPLFETLSALVIGATGEGLVPTLPWYFYLKLTAFFILAFFGLLQVVLRITTYYYAVWSKGVGVVHPMHVPYQPESQMSMISLLNWKLYRLFALFTPPVVLLLITGFVGLIELYIFNYSVGLPFIGLSVQFIIALFLLMVFSLFTGLAFVNSIWNYFTTVFGDVVAVTEPELPAKTVFDRCGRVAFGSPLIWVFYAGYLCFLVAVGMESVWLLTHHTVQDLLLFRANVPLILVIEVITLFFYISMNYVRFMAYHQSLGSYYAKLPSYLTDRYQFKL